VELDLLPGGGSLRAELRSTLDRLHAPARIDELTSEPPGYDPALWSALAGDGWLARCASPSAGGHGRVSSLAVVLEELGRARVPSPVQNGVVQSTWALDAVASPADAARRGGGVTAGTARTALCLAGPTGRVAAGALGARLEDGRLDGVKRFVPYADSADLLLVVADGPGDGVTLAAVPATVVGVTVQAAASIAGDRQAEVRFDGVRVAVGDVVGEPGGAWDGLVRAMLVATTALCAEAVGASAALIERTVARASARTQFGTPIGAMPAVQQRCADMAIDHLAALGALDEAVQCIDAGHPAEVEVAAAKAVCGASCLRVAASAHQVWGGTGYLADAGIHHWTRLIKGLDAQLGTARAQRQLTATRLRQRGGWSTHG
jgi:alkylation response protein AidB-like acyl-CoA dehydrogenase